MPNSTAFRFQPNTSSATRGLLSSNVIVTSPMARRRSGHAVKSIRRPIKFTIFVEIPLRAKVDGFIRDNSICAESSYYKRDFNIYLIPNTAHNLTGRGVGLKVLTGQGAAIDTTTATGKLVFGIFAALSEFERELISERTVAGLASARARGRKGGRPFKMTAAKLRLAMAAMGQPETVIGNPCKELGIARQTLYRHVSPNGELRPDGVKLLSNG
ncbi:recombinase family protein [Methylicorpusculum oleiharenae]